MRELRLDEIESISGGGISNDTAYSTALTVSTGFALAAVAGAAIPIAASGIAVLTIGSYAATGLAFVYGS